MKFTTIRREAGEENWTIAQDDLPTFSSENEFVLLGGSRIGKTTLMNQMAFKAREELALYTLGRKNRRGNYIDKILNVAPYKANQSYSVGYTTYGKRVTVNYSLKGLVDRTLLNALCALHLSAVK